MTIKKIPQQESRNRLRVGIQGSPTITASPHSVTNGYVQGMRYVNCFPVEIPQFATDPIHILNKAPGIESTSSITLNGGSLGAVGWSNIGNFIQYFPNVGLISGTPTGYFITSGGSTGAVIGTMQGTTMTCQNTLTAGATLPSPAIIAYNQAYTVNGIVYVSHGATNTFNVATIGPGTSWTIASNNYASPFANRQMIAAPPVYMNDRVYWLDVANSVILNTDPLNGTPTYTAGNFIAPQIQADNFVGLYKYKNHLCALGRASIEFFFDGGLSLGSPLVRQEQYLIRTGMSFITNGVMYGDIMYFMGVSDEQGWGLYEVANFNLRKVSSPAIDALLNNIDDYVGSASIQLTLNLVDVYGHPVLVLSFQNTLGSNIAILAFEIPKRPYGIMAPTDGQWWEWPALSSVTLGLLPSLSTAPIAAAYPLVFHTDPLNTQYPAANSSAGGSFYVTYPTNTTAVFNFIGKNRSATAAQSTTGTYVTNMLDFDENQWKHIEYVDVIGDFGNNAITLSYTTDPTYQSANWITLYSQTQSTIGPKNTLRWHNIGPARQIAFRIDMAGTSNVVFKGLELSYNMGTF